MTQTDSLSAPLPTTAVSRLRQGDLLRAAIWALVVLAGVMAVAFPVYMLFCGRERLVAYVSDDAYYYFNVAGHLAKGEGPTADGVTVTTGFHPLYAFLLAGTHTLTNPSLDGFIRQSIVLNAVCFIAAAVFLYLAAKRLWSGVAGAAAALLWLSNPHANLISTTGLEGSVYSLTLALLFWRLAVFVVELEQSEDHGRFWRQVLVLGVVGGMVVLSRTDAITLLPLVAIVMLVAARRIRWTQRALGVGATCVIGVGFLSLWWYYAWRYTGQIVQGSAAIKMLWHETKAGGDTFAAGAAFAAAVWTKYLYKSFFKVPALLWVLSTFPALFVWRTGRGLGRAVYLHTLWIFPAGIGLAYALFIDRPRTWYYVPALIGLTLISAGGVHYLLTVIPANRLWALARKFAPLLAWVVVIESGAIFARDAIYGRSGEQVNAIAAAEMLVQDVPPGTRLGCWHSGIVQYYTPGLTVINLDGLANNEILPVLRGEKTMNDYWDERNITVLLGAPRAKMGTYAEEWDGKRLVTVRAGVQRVVEKGD